jgi:hypothetical protein
MKKDLSPSMDQVSVVDVSMLMMMMVNKRGSMGCVIHPTLKTPSMLPTGLETSSPQLPLGWWG